MASFFSKARKKYQGYQRNRYFNKVKKEVVREALSQARQSVGAGTFESGRETTPQWEKGILSSLTDVPLRRNPVRSTTVLETLKILRDVNPDASLAAWNFQRMANPGHELEVYDINGEINQKAQDYINQEIAPKVGKLYSGGADQLINVLNLSGYTLGAMALEVELEENLKDVKDFHVLDPTTLSYVPNKETGELDLCERQLDGTFKRLNENQVFYVPLDPDIDDPYGRSPILPAIEAVQFQMEVLSDLKAVAHHQGHARFDVAVSTEAIVANLPANIVHDKAKVKAWVSNYIATIKQGFDELEPDDDFYHDDSIKVDTVGGTNGKSIDSNGLIKIVNQQVVSSLKQLPILMGQNEGTTETHGTVQYKIFISGVEAIQDVTKRLIERAYNTALQVQGYQATAKVTFNNIETEDRKAEAEAEEIEIRNAKAKYDNGWITHDEASQAVTGHDAVAEPKATSYDLTSPFVSSLSNSKKALDKEFPRLALSRADSEKQGDDELVDGLLLEMGEPWSEAVARLSVGAAKSFHSILKNQQKRYIERVAQAPEPPKPSNRTGGFDEFLTWFTDYILTAFYPTDTAEWKESLSTWLFDTVSQVGHINTASLSDSLTFNELDENLLAWIDWSSTNNAVEIADTTFKNVMDTLWDVVYDGDYTIDKAQEALKNATGFSEARSRVIARTEILTATSTGQYSSDLQSDMVIGKTWNSTYDGRTRHAHSEADGQTKPFNEPFIVDGESLMFPRDRANGASAKNVIQCRCFYTRILEGQEDKLKELLENQGDN